MIEYIFEEVTISGKSSALGWIAQYLMARNISFIFDAGTGHLSFVQNCPADRTCGILSTVQYIIGNCPHRKWDIVSQNRCFYSDIQNR